MDKTNDCFHCNQPGHLKRDCPELPYCSKCRTKGHVLARCPTKQQDAGQAPEGHEFHGPNHESNELHRDEWKRSQDQPRFSNPDNRCLNCAGNHATHDCPTRHQQQAPTTSSPASGSGIYNSQSNLNISSPPNSSLPQNSQQSQSTVGVTMPTLMVIKPQGNQVLPQALINCYNTLHNNSIPNFHNHHLHKLAPCYIMVNHLTHKYHHHTSHNMHLLTALPWAVKLLILQ